MPGHSFKAMILAAGRGERMRPLTDTLPKPLLRAGKHMLIEYHLQNLAQAGFRDIVINHAYLGHMIEAALGDGQRYGLHITYSKETTILETAGGIANALPLLTRCSANQPFLVVNADIFCQIDYAILLPALQRLQINSDGELAHLVLVDNPPHHPDGDFFLEQGRLTARGLHKLTFSGIGVYHPDFFNQVAPGTATKLSLLLGQAIPLNKVGGEYYPGIWMDIGTPERLQWLTAHIKDIKWR
ncbi:N-acetylmuramate alpha-1-phosphate uridylyltransferase MurU [Nitrosomonas sp. Nm34]|uniref:N-acetylmuramate alpha-1-phosphate uridylyltransferase MurU n=1 Tax=Nitrosomonas sp. Nm34 TaxID=1881055 RepID=UPI0008F125A7|nr:nucleotidyltransferase family protein [Nitrosomonas sp. Nm34]SFI92990.1 MurNAc alpha-1-phosphate uridylyltransferase [Nitrosomonas sp. Nm34]